MRLARISILEMHFSARMAENKIIKCLAWDIRNAQVTDGGILGGDTFRLHSFIHNSTEFIEVVKSLKGFLPTVLLSVLMDVFSFHFDMKIGVFSVLKKTVSLFQFLQNKRRIYNKMSLLLGETSGLYAS